MGERDDLVGREAESAQLAAFLAAPDGQALLVRGEAGVGKTALVAELAESAAAENQRVVRAVGVEAESTLPFSGLHQLLHPLLRRADELGPDQRAALDAALGRAARPAPSVMVLGIAVLDLLTMASLDRPLLLVIDDGQWIDGPSADVLSFVGRRLSGLAVKAVIALRSDAEAPFDGAGLPELRVGVLPEDAAGRLVDARNPGLASEMRSFVLDQAGGNPLALLELPAALRARDRMDLTQVLNLGNVPVPRRLEGIYSRRIASLSPAVRAELLRGALDGVESGTARRRVVATRYRMRGVEDAMAQGLLQVDPVSGDFVFRHPLVRSAVVQVATPNERRAAHANLAELHRGDLERRAVHLAAATVDPDDAIAMELEHAAHLATLRGGAVTAVAWLTRAAELAEHPARRARLLEEAAFVAGQAALLDRAQDLLDESGRLFGAEQSPASVLTAAYVALYRDGDVRGSYRSLLTAVESLPDDADTQTRSRLLNGLLAVCVFAADPALWARTDTLIDTMLTAGADRVDPLTLLYRDTWGDVVRRGVGADERLEEAFVRLSGGEPWDLARLGISAYHVDRLGEFRAHLRRAMDRESESGAATNVITMLELTMLDQIASGAWDEAEETGRRGLELSRTHGHPLFGHQFGAYLGILAAGRGDVRRALALQVEIERWGRPRGLGLLTQFAEVIAVQCAMAEGDWESAYTYASGLSTPGVFAAYRPQALRTLLDLVEAALHTGRADQAGAHARAARDQGLPAISPRLDLVTRGALAMTAPDNEAGPLFADALSHPAGGDFPFELARIQLAHGMWLRRTRERNAARDALARAVDTFDGMGATPWADRARAELRAAGAGPRAAGTGAVGGVATLTAQERQIAELAAGGLSNKEIGAKLFLSPRTVGAHLYRIFPKLGITSRASLRDALNDGEEARSAGEAPRPGDL